MKKAVIIGAGPAGLTAAYELLKQSKEYEVLVLEQGNCIGGICKTINCSGNRMDMGGHRFFSKDSRINAWWEEILPLQGSPAQDDKKTGRQAGWNPKGPDPEKEDNVMLLRKRVSHIYYNGKLFDYPVKMNVQTIRSLGAVLTLQAGFSFLKTRFHKLPETSLENFYINRFGRTLYEMFFRSYTYKLWGRHPNEISAEWGAQRVKGLSVTEVLKDSLGRLFSIQRKEVETSLIEEFRYPKYGPGQLWETVAQRIEQMGGTILLNSQVCNLMLEDKSDKQGIDSRKISKISYQCNRETHNIHADVVFSTMPLQNLLRGMNGVPKKMREIGEGLSYREFVTVGVLVEQASLQKLNHKHNAVCNMPDCWIYVQDPKVRMGRIQIFNNWSPYMVQHPEETVWMGLEYFCGKDDDDWNRSEQDWVSLAVSELRSMHMIQEDAPVLQAHCEKVEKAYPAYFDTYAKMDELIAWLDCVTNLYCIGRNGQHRYNNMDHSMLTAMEAVEHLLGQSTQSRRRIWNVNTEKSYHEQENEEV